MDIFVAYFKKCCYDDLILYWFLPVNIDDMHFYEKMIKKTLCLMNCKNNTMPEASSQLPKEVMDDFEWKMPYDYLQLCYYQVRLD